MIQLAIVHLACLAVVVELARRAPTMAERVPVGRDQASLREVGHGPLGNTMR